MAYVRAPIVGLTASLLVLTLGLATPSASAATSAPMCAPSTLNTSALLDGAVTVSPLLGTVPASARLG
jgi:hypothetical protein